MTRQIKALCVLALIAAPNTGSAAVFDCSTALERTQEAAKEIATRAVGKDQRCNVERELLPLFERQITIVEICEADHAKISLVKEMATRSKAHYQRACGTESPPNSSEAF